MTSGETQIIAWLLTVPGIGQGSCRRLVRACQARHRSLRSWWGAGQPRLDAAFSATQSQQIQAHLVARPFKSFGEWLAKWETRLVSESSTEYPPLLKQIADRPVLLFVTGSQLDHRRLPIAVVGTRKNTPYGRLVTTKIVSELVARGATIISGGMYGIDLLAHQTALEAGGETVVILGFGFGRWYPVSYQTVGQQLLKAGATFVSEYPPLTAPSKGSFPQRNRLIAGMSEAVVVTEAGVPSGSHITAQFAAEYGREVMAVPGAITNPYAAGTAALINEGATLVGSGQDVFQQLRPELINQSLANIDYNIDSHSPLAQQVLAGLKSQASSLDELEKLTQAPLAALFSVLTTLEMAGQICKSGDRWHLQ